MGGCLRRLIGVGLLLVLVSFVLVVAPSAFVWQHGPVRFSGASGQAPAQAAGCTGTDNRAGGQMAFGTGLDVGSLTLSCVTSSFPSGSPFAWRAQFLQPVSAGVLSVVIARTYNSGATEQAVLTQTEVVSGPNTDAFGAQTDPGLLVRLGPGDYAMRLISGTTVLAEGRFSVMP